MASVQLTIHRGSHEVGGSCIELSTANTRLVLDVGLPLFGADRQPLDTFSLRSHTKDELAQRGLLPPVAGLFDNEAPSPDAILLTHGHLDHTGLLGQTNSEIPVYATRGTSKMMLAGSLFARQVAIPRARHRPLMPGEATVIGDVKVIPFSVDHSIYGCVALLLEAAGKSIFYTGDLRLHGRKTGMAREIVRYFNERSLDVLLMEGTHFGLHDGQKLTEYELEEQITEHVRQAPGLVLASFSPQHLDRLVCFIRTAVKTKRTFVADAYTAFLLYLIHREVKNVPVPGRDEGFPVFFPATLLKNEGKSKWLKEKCPFMFEARITIDQILAEPARHLMVFRPSMLEHDFQGTLPENVLCLHSRWEGYLDGNDWKQTRKLIDQAQGQLIQAHTSGHILAEDIAGFVDALKPKTVLPIHTFEPTEFEQHFANVQVLEDSQVYRL